MEGAFGKAGDYEVKDIAASGGASGGSPAMLADGSIYTHGKSAWLQALLM